jgi:hypothetical protein
MPPITVSTEVERSAEDVFAYATDPTRFREWQAGVIDGHMDQPGNPSVGAHCLTTRRIGGANRPSTSEVVRFNPPSTWGVRGIDGPIRAIVDVTVEPLAAQRSAPDDCRRLRRPRHRQAARPAHRPPRGPQGDAHQPGGLETTSRAPIAQHAGAAIVGVRSTWRRPPARGLTDWVGRL